MPQIEVTNVSKIFRSRRGPGKLLAGGGVAHLLQKREPVVALRDISFTVEAGESFGIIGANGSGKSTLLKLLAGVTVPTSGHISVTGRVVSLLELGAGFHPLLTGRENIFLNARILGMSTAETEAVFDQIVEFSGIEDFIDNPVTTYSSGMYVRLGFAVAAHTSPDIFLVDEVLSVGDEEFQRKCRTRIGELREQGRTLVFVSHDLGIVNTLCTSVILLSKGRMISRGSPQATIDYYLRQVGRECGIHAFSAGDSEAIFSHGRLTMFHKRHELSAPSGLRMGLESTGQWHESTTAIWNVTEREPQRCVARGQMARLPVALLWDMRIEDGRLVWDMAIECEREVALRALRADLFWPPDLTRWIYAGASGLFPSILPGDLSWMPVAAIDYSCREMALLPREGTEGGVTISLDPRSRHTCLSCYNSDYLQGARVAQALVQMPEDEAVFSEGRHPIMSLSIGFALSSEDLDSWLKDHEAQRTVASGALKIRFDGGRMRIMYDGEELTSYLRFYTSILVGNLWNDSFNLQWTSPERNGATLLCSGESRRFPFRQHWSITPVEKGVAVEVWLEALEPIDILEYHASIVLRPEYATWETEHEAGPYPPFDPDVDDWRHANRIYAPGARASASGPSLPTVTLEAAAGIPFRMTAINTGFHENARVLQALRTPETGLLHFEKGRHLYFSGIISVKAHNAPPERD